MAHPRWASRWARFFDGCLDQILGKRLLLDAARGDGHADMRQHGADFAWLAMKLGEFDELAHLVPVTVAEADQKAPARRPSLGLARIERAAHEPENLKGDADAVLTLLRGLEKPALVMVNGRYELSASMAEGSKRGRASSSRFAFTFLSMSRIGTLRRSSLCRRASHASSGSAAKKAMNVGLMRQDIVEP